MRTDLRIQAKCNEIAEFLIEKNNSYGDSALHPISVFASGDAVANLNARIDDKLARIRNAPLAYGEDVVKDLTGYLVLLQLAMEDQNRTEK